MPTISKFCGMIIRMYFLDTKHHNEPHIHVQHQEKHSVILIPSGRLIDGKLETKRLGQLQKWIKLHEQELMKNWTHAVKGEQIFPIAPL
ncbi:DUF4160 domain-containing protein [Massilia sp. FT127W]|uniref:DUF4160 domain-containing protein n=1 Tax=Pseudoduganella aquatica TaxID=2660641 RepID=A0A7X4HCW6_9BURK|nr:DUF4160 domain-containing protein [Pseudoduganella aquatica]